MSRGTERHSSGRAATRSEGLERLFDPRDNSVGRQIVKHRSMNPIRMSAGICGSCDAPIDAMSGECGCSA